MSVVIPTRDRWPLLERALTSVLAQEAVELEVIVVDDGSSDETPARLEAMTDRRIRVKRNETPTGVSRARNCGIEAARGDWVAFLDDDDFWAPEKLRTQVRACLDDGARFSYTGFVIADPSLERRRVASAFPTADLRRAIFGMNMIGSPSSVIARRSLLDEVGGFDPSFSILADWDLWIRLTLGASAAACDEALTCYLAHTENMSLDVHASQEELRRLRVKHDDAAREQGVRLGGVDWWLWIAASMRRSGARIRSAGTYLWIAARWARPSALLRAAAALADGPVTRWALRRHHERTKGGDRSEEAAWVDAFVGPGPGR